MAGGDGMGCFGQRAPVAETDLQDVVVRGQVQQVERGQVAGVAL